MFLRVLTVQRRPDVDDVEWTIVHDGPAAVEQATRVAFDAVYFDLAVPPLDGWLPLAEFGAWSVRPRLVARAETRRDAERATILGTDAVVAARCSAAVLRRALQPVAQAAVMQEV